MLLRQRLALLKKLSSDDFDSDPDWQENFDKTFEKDQLSKLEKQYDYDVSSIDNKSFRYSFFKDILSLENFKVINSGLKNPILGKGHFGTVFSGTYNGKPAAAKIVLYDNKSKMKFNKEVENWNKILSVSNQLNDDLKKHIPKIYKIDTGEISKDNTSQTYLYEVIIMEQLFPLNEHMLKLIDQNKIRIIYDENYEQEIIPRQAPPESFVNSINDLLKDPDYLYTIANKIKESYADAKIDKNKIVKELLELNLDFNKKDIAIDKITNIILDDNDIDMEHFNFVRTNVAYIMRIFFDKIGLPKSLNEHDLIGDYYNHLPETANFIKALKEIYKLSGLKYYDLKSDNIMMDKDGNLKIIDVGQYK